MPILKQLSYKNFLLFKDLDIELSKGLNIITGESGAGKSLLLEGLNLLLGSKAKKDLFSALNSKAVLEGIFELNDNSECIDFLKSNELDIFPELIVRREITYNGRSRCFVNDSPVSMQVLSELGNLLCEIHGQHETSFIRSNSYQIDLLDSYSNTFELRENYKNIYLQIEKTKAELEELKAKQAEAVKEQDYLSYLQKELEDANLNDSDEEKNLEEEQEILANASEIVQLTEAISYGVEEGEQSLETLVYEIRNSIKSLAQLSSSFKEDLERFESAWLELKEVANDIGNKGNKISIDPQRLNEVEERISLFQHLKMKHNASDISELMEIREQISNNLLDFTSLENKINSKEKELSLSEKSLVETAEKLSKARKDNASKLSEKVIKILHELEIPSAVLDIKIEKLDREKWNKSGSDKITFLFSANAGMEPKTLENTASGGELSRVMLAFKSISEYNHLLTIFDEIDTGVSGETAMKVGRLINKMSDKLQIIVITHLPQVASKGNSHFVIKKTEKDNNAFSNLYKLDKDNRINEVARLLSGENPSEKAKKNAEELLGAIS